MSPQSGVFFEKNANFRHFYLIKGRGISVIELEKCDLSVYVCLYHWHLELIPLIIYQEVEKLQIIKINIFHVANNPIKGPFNVMMVPKTFIKLEN